MRSVFATLVPIIHVCRWPTCQSASDFLQRHLSSSSPQHLFFSISQSSKNSSMKITINWEISLRLYFFADAATIWALWPLSWGFSIKIEPLPGRPAWMLFSQGANFIQMVSTLGAKCLGTFTRDDLHQVAIFQMHWEKKLSRAKGANYLDDHGRLLRLVIMMMKVYGNLENYRLRFRLFLRNNDSFPVCLKG